MRCIKTSAFAILCFALFAGAAFGAELAALADIAGDAARRPDRSPIEGIWAVPQKWDPDPEQALDYRIAIVRNEYGGFAGAEYIGVVLCDKKGSSKGDVRLALYRSDGRDKYNAVWHTNKGDVRGEVSLIPNANGEGYAAIETSGLKWGGNILVKALVRVKE